MKFKCTCEEARAVRVRRRLQDAALPYCFYAGLLNRPVFAFESEAEMMRAVMAAGGDLLMLASEAPPRGEAGKLTFGLRPTSRMAPPPPRKPAAKAEAAPRVADPVLPIRPRRAKAL
ncbi:MAG TPA: hypothetical protein VFS04_11270 [Alphaproteobacteria bacterium]|nr:hypothetical protein [Alphaproteobacteria bacterium]